jgi:hypothetical protein
MLFKKNDSANLVLKSTKYWKNRPQKTKEAQNVVFNLKGRIPLLFYCVKHIHGQFKTYLKLRSIHFKQIAKTIPTFGANLAVIFFKIRFILYAVDFPICTILFLLICYVFIALYGVLTAVLFFFETCKVKSVYIKTLFLTR